MPENHLAHVTLQSETIELFLVNGTTNGIVTAKIKGHDCYAIKIPRDLIRKYSGKELEHNGVYLLYGDNEDGEFVYIGKAAGKGGLKARLETHISNDSKDGRKYANWDLAVCFYGLGIDETLSLLLESKFYNQATKHERNVLTQRTSKNSETDASKTSQIEKFTSYSRSLLSVLGYNTLDDISDDKAIEINDSDNIFKLKFGSGEARGIKDDESGCFTVLKGSQVCDSSKEDALGKKTRIMYNFEENTENCILKKDIEFSSPTAAAKFVLGRSANGRSEWKNRGRSINEIESAQ